MLADSGWIAVKDGRNREATQLQSLIARKRRAEIARSDYHDFLHVVRAQNALKLADQHGNVVSDAALAELPEVRQISPNLSRVDIRES
jgi:hypothetical protein